MADNCGNHSLRVAQKKGRRSHRSGGKQHRGEKIQPDGGDRPERLEKRKKAKKRDVLPGRESRGRRCQDGEGKRRGIKHDHAGKAER